MKTSADRSGGAERAVRVPARDLILPGVLRGDGAALGLIVFADARGCGVARGPLGAALVEAGFATLGLDLLTGDEPVPDVAADPSRLAERLVLAIDWLGRDVQMWRLAVGLLATGAAAAAALVAEAERAAVVNAVVVCGGRPDVAGEALARVEAPTLLVVGETGPVAVLGRDGLAHLRCAARLDLIPDASEGALASGALPEIAARARLWFERYLGERARAVA